MKLHRMQSVEDPNWDQVWKIYQMNFPKGERRRIIDQTRTLDDKRYYCMAILKKDLVCGILFYWMLEDFCFVEHLAIDDQVKGRGLGSSILENLKDLPGRLVLEIDPPTDPIAIRRKAFYERAGFVLNPHEHLNLPLRIGYEALPLRVMTLKKPLSQVEYKTFNEIMIRELIHYGEAYRMKGA